ncbi:toll/interleukin-1 receptor domain-containing protein [Kibdelosporangium persicum]|uniref:Toll/interleukin-1 receptor domain-containing protein n=1 Tax=Kibdelosporangium persicum TaxID=2698649 RepID=A0ABX2FGT4_9PSEU|nr:Toll/interleukin-1 receptor domain-containing protein [Kibdelosporangium persicum]
MYEYDVFISYQRAGNTVPPWVRNHFYPRLTELLDDQLDHDVRIFFDENVTGGAKWPVELQNALRRTRVLVPVCSPKYFLSEWCMAEWHSMARREELVSRTAATRRHSLIYPVIFCDSRNFPDYAHERQMRDFRSWAFPYAHFQESQAYLDFHREMMQFAEELTELIEAAPQWRPDWPVTTPGAERPRPSHLPRF